MTQKAGQPETESGDLKLNTLCYQILGVLLRRPRSGYDIVKQLENIRPVKTSQVYPTLARLEKIGLVRSQEVHQTSRPNKRIYSVLEKGEIVLMDWVGTEPEPPVWKDDFLTMIYSAWTKDPEDVLAMFERRLNYLTSVMEMMRDLLAEHRNKYPEEIFDPRDWRFSRDILLNRRLMSYEQEVVWSKGVMFRLTEAMKNDASKTEELKHE